MQLTLVLHPLLHSSFCHKYQLRPAHNANCSIIFQTTSPTLNSSVMSVLVELYKHQHHIPYCILECVILSPVKICTNNKHARQRMNGNSPLWASHQESTLPRKAPSSSGPCELLVLHDSQPFCEVLLRHSRHRLLSQSGADK